MATTGSIETFQEIDWKIEDFEKIELDHVSKSIRSPLFNFGKYQFNLKVIGANKRGSHSVFLEVKSTDNFNFGCCLSLRRNDSSLFRSREAENIRLEYCFPDFLKRDFIIERKEEFISSGALTLVISIFQREERGKITKKRKYKKEEDDVYKDLELLSDNIEKLYLEKEKCDATIKVNSREFQVHKAILCGRSNVFKMTFKHSTVESTTNVINITDCDPDAFECYIRYLYSGVLKIDSAKYASEIYCIADKYDNPELKTFCIKYLLKNVRAENVCNVFEFALKYNEIDLKKRAEDFFKENVSSVLKTEEWVDFLSRNHILANELLRKMADYRLDD